MGHGTKTCMSNPVVILPCNLKLFLQYDVDDALTQLVACDIYIDGLQPGRTRMGLQVHTETWILCVSELGHGALAGTQCAGHAYSRSLVAIRARAVCQLSISDQMET